MSDKKFSIIHFEEIESTNITALELLKNSKAVLPYGVVADMQTKGIGTRGRQWESPSGNLYVTYCFQDIQKEDISALSLVVACAVLKTFEALGYEILFKVKWPNDIYLNGKKIAGILISKFEIDGQAILSIGIGINFNNAPLTQNRDYQSGCLSEVYKNLPDKDLFAEYLGINILDVLKNFKDRGFLPYQDYWMEYAYLKKEQVQFNKDNGDIIKGIFTGVSQDGAAMIFSEEKLHYCYSGKLMPVKTI